MNGVLQVVDSRQQQGNGKGARQDPVVTPQKKKEKTQGNISVMNNPLQLNFGQDSKRHKEN